MEIGFEHFFELGDVLEVVFQARGRILPLLGVSRPYRTSCDLFGVHERNEADYDSGDGPAGNPQLGVIV